MARLEAHSTQERIPIFTLTNGISPPRPSDLRSAVERFSSACAHRAILPTDPASVDLLLSLSPDQQAILTSIPAPADVFMAPLLPRISVPATYAPLDLAAVRTALGPLSAAFTDPALAHGLFGITDIELRAGSGASDIFLLPHPAPGVQNFLDPATIHAPWPALNRKRSAPPGSKTSSR